MAKTNTKDEKVAELHREVSLNLLKHLPVFAVRTPRGQKEPGHYRWDPKNNTKDLSNQVIHELERTDDNVGVHLFGEVVDVDVDSDEPLLSMALDYFLPSTQHVWGRPSRLRSHRLYMVSGTDGGIFDRALYPFLNMLGQFKDISVEIRGGKLMNGEYSLMPGSVHPSGEFYLWENPLAAKSGLVTVPVTRLVDSVRMACVAATVAQHWGEGQRNSLCLALSGFLHRATSYTTEMASPGDFYLDKEACLNLLKGICEIADDDPEDWSSRKKTFEKTWEKAESGVPVQGATTLSELTGDEEIVRKLYLLLTDSRGLVDYEEFAKDFVLWVGEAKIVNKRLLGMPGASPIMSSAQFHDSYQDKIVETPSGGKPMTRVFMTSKNTTRVTGMTFSPGKEELYANEYGRWLNTWSGFEIEPHPDPVKEKDVEPFVDYMYRVVSSSNDIWYSWIIAWVADVFKNPDKKCGTALVLVGLPGAGKSFLGHGIMGKIIGSRHYTPVNDIEVVTGRFNLDTAYQILIQCDEALSIRQRSAVNRLKALITDPFRRVEPKNVNAFKVEEHSRYLFTSNNIDEAVAIVDGQADRRFSVFHINEEYSEESDLHDAKEKRAYWDALASWTSNPENLAKVHRFLVDLSYDKSLVTRPLDTEARRLTQQNSMRGFDEWLMGIVSMEHPLGDMKKVSPHWAYIKLKDGSLEPDMSKWPDYMPYSAVKDSYDLYRRKKGSQAAITEYNEQQIVNQFRSRSLLPDKVPHQMKSFVTTEYVDGDIVEVKRRQRVRKFPTKQEIESYLSKRYGFSVDEGEPEELVENTVKKQLDKEVEY